VFDLSLLSLVRYCHTCCELLYPTDLTEHKAHHISTGLSQDLLSHPTQLLTPVTERKSQAQFFYTQSTTDFLSNELKRQGFTHVICIGVPRLHEHLLTKYKGSMSSFLLDIDHRYAQFYPLDSFQRYNMLNGFFFEEYGEKEICMFAPEDLRKVVVVMDPPFGALAGLLARHTKGLWRLLGQETKTVITFPYFLEEKLLDHFTDFSMSDYQVSYDNHSVFSGSKKNRPSAVRFFTNFASPGLKLLKQDGYRFCSVCCKYTAKNNQHCYICNTCPSKDGRPYVHCDMCKKCVKPGRVHCSTCDRCDVPEHICQTHRCQVVLGSMLSLRVVMTK
jgi:hypothetical protein